MTRAGLPHSDTLGSQLGWQLPQAYRSLPRPSSAPGTKASTICPTQLQQTKTTTPTNPHTPTQTKKGPNKDMQASRHKKLSRRKQDARVHYAHLNQQPTTPTTRNTCHHNSDRLPHQGAIRKTATHKRAPARKPKPRTCGLVFSGPNRVPATDCRPPRPTPGNPQPHLSTTPTEMSDSTQCHGCKPRSDYASVSAK